MTSWPHLAAIPEDEEQLVLDREVHQLAERLEVYFAGERISFEFVPLPPGTAFQHSCWLACRSTPFGATVSYSDLAVCMGHSPSAARAIGQAMKRNPQPVVTPCHRVLAKAGALRGYAGSSLKDSPALRIKRALLELER